LTDYQSLKQHIKYAAEKFRQISKDSGVRVISHLDADGIAACSILVRALEEEGLRYSVSVVNQLNGNAIESLANEDSQYIFFTDLGSGQLETISEKLKDKKVFILDHHEMQGKASDNIVHVNPHLFGIDGGKEISGAGVVYLFAKELNEKNISTAHIAIIGAIGDIQESKGFMQLNNEILEDAKSQGLIEVKEGLRFFGSQTRPLHKVLEYSSDPFIPGVSGSESSAIQFLSQIGIYPKNGSSWKKLKDLREDEMKKLVAGVIMKRSGEENPEDVLGYSYILPNEKEGKPFRDAREFSTLLNACGRLNKASLGIGACLGHEKIKRKAMEALDNYKGKIIKAMDWFKANKDSDFVFNGNNFMIINAEDNIMVSMIGTIASILSKSADYENGFLILSMAQAIDNTTKASLRICGRRDEDIDLRETIKEIARAVGGDFGGHKLAAGAVFPTEKEQEFIEAAKQVLAKRSIEEKIV
jgi:RecJ-like exonuclease